VVASCLGKQAYMIAMTGSPIVRSGKICNIFTHSLKFSTKKRWRTRLPKVKSAVVVNEEVSPNSLLNGNHNVKPTG
jgi:hypothetical protein